MNPFSMSAAMELLIQGRSSFVTGPPGPVEALFAWGADITQEGIWRLPQ